ncbi:Myb-like DNA-binding domain containing protein [Trichomonas vaginalis G3]|uniref:Myb-like DNA-binding domain containing protein n=1 Tax=Trichomonas vaginalis (strain ATCC PRA-98 / G3) TaxID=412133 RepID=A2FBV5_TRIV3|nr:RNA polymerase II transcription regulator recruiting protein [Trichomonas vaginalis G3]XP_001310532.1 RNA polymerase II transcription regulator recruiting protein [Trichomonas vaginalis G3]EAX79614.1 Myb-like DNA-binding domain containing protein [Trichomonas vaginalis G3]EAX97601.1 Myb-like DNA-binding domain containing protein [Trichomonas vaginalis G3]EAX97602.1 Myb-like DNA-binding domain containing protein [Trichomonas vaginalis G3]KAI5510584.1 RNA polymerase II transcription regulator|eukprot:XP_001292544.1 Myb-like DNA-binding domain containing protein [Trichomonas vaginalis G3]
MSIKCDDYKKTPVLYRKRFTAEEDELLRKLAKDNTNKTWRDIAKHLPGRSATQCRDRYNQYLFPSVVSKPWSDEEDRIIVEKYKQYGPHWSKISEFLPGRSGSNIKNRWNGALSRFHGIPHKKSKLERRQPRNILNALAQSETAIVSPSSDESSSDAQDIFDQLTEGLIQQEYDTFDLFNSWEDITM